MYSTNEVHMEFILGTPNRSSQRSDVIICVVIDWDHRSLCYLCCFLHWKQQNLMYYCELMKFHWCWVLFHWRWLLLHSCPLKLSHFFQCFLWHPHFHKVCYLSESNKMHIVCICAHYLHSKNSSMCIPSHQWSSIALLSKLEYTRLLPMHLRSLWEILLYQKHKKVGCSQCLLMEHG